MWLIGLWMAFHDHLPTGRPAHGVIAAIYSVTDFFGRTATLAGLTFCAYIIGCILDASSSAFLSAYNRLAKFLPGVPSVSWASRAAQIDAGLLITKLQYGHLLDIGYRKAIQDQKDGIQPPEPDESQIARMKEVQNSLATLLRGLELERDQLVTRLRAKNADLFSDHDRKSAEADFRVNAAAALMCMAVLLIFTVSPIFLALIPVSVWLARQGFSRYVDSNDVLLQALVIGEIESSMLKQLTETGWYFVSPDAQKAD